MRFPALILALTGAMFLTGCSNLVSLNPFATDKDSTFDPALTGVWHDSDDDTYIVKRSGDHYGITYIDKSEDVMKFEAWLFETGDATLLDLVSKKDAPFHVPAHTPLRVWIDGATLKFAFLDSDWLRQQVAQELTAQTIDGRVVLTAPNVSARAFLAKHGADTRAYGEIATLQKQQ
ncbi:MAG TPA: hypothetical protein VKU01_16040 [Bryobacteraceae bacterium]|nr:hypothetical protein [Bryobacteraceae bacterium]